MADADHKLKQKAWRQANAEKLKAYARAYYLDNKDKAAAYAAEHYRANAEAYKKRSADWAAANPERRYEIASQWRDQHPEVYAAARKKDWVVNKPVRQAAAKQYRKENSDFVKSLVADWKKRNPAAGAHHVGLRRSRLLQAMPAWADVQAIKQIYQRAKTLTAETGVAHHVDHFYPLKSPLVCGLHNEFNLRVIPAAENMSKRNKLVDA